MHDIARFLIDFAMFLLCQICNFVGRDMMIKHESVGSFFFFERRLT